MCLFVEQTLRKQLESHPILLLLDAGLYTNKRPGSCHVCWASFVVLLLPHRFLLERCFLDCRRIVSCIVCKHIAAANWG